MAVWTKLTGRSVSGVQSATDTPPVHGAGGGLNLNDVAGFSVTFECDSGQTFSAASGSFQAWFDDPLLSGVSYTPELDLVLPASAIGQRRITFAGFTVATPRGFLAHIANGITVTGGGLTVIYTCSSLHGSQT
jgi:hypothetical protein